MFCFENDISLPPQLDNDTTLKYLITYGSYGSNASHQLFLLKLLFNNYIDQSNPFTIYFNYFTNLEIIEQIKYPIALRNLES